MSNTIEIKVPDIGDFGDVPVIELLVSAGDTVGPDDGLVTLESDKATMEVPSPAAGVIRELRVGLEDTVSEGDVVYIPAGVPHWYRAQGGEPFEFLCVVPNAPDTIEILDD